MKPRFFSTGTILSFFAQLFLFSVATTAVTLLYLSYRNDDFLQTFAVIGMILTLPWLAISLLPTVLALKDRELRRQLLWGQLTTMVFIFAAFYGLSAFLGLDTVIFSTLSREIENLVAELPVVIEQLRKTFEAFYQAVLSLYRDTRDLILP